MLPVFVKYIYIAIHNVVNILFILNILSFSEQPTTEHARENECFVYTYTMSR